MSVQQTHEKNLRKYVIAILLFLAVVALSLAVFFASLFTNVDRAVERKIREEMVRQSNHIDFAFAVRFQNLESAADFLGKQEDIHGEIAQACTQSLGATNTMVHVVIYDMEGNAVAENGATFVAKNLSHIQPALRGERSVSDPVESPYDGVTYVYLSVPIKRGDEVVGALSCSFGVEQLGSLLFADNYNGQSVVFITDRSGTIGFSDSSSNKYGLYNPMNLYDLLRQASVLDGETVDGLIAKVERQENGMVRYRMKKSDTLFLLYSPIANSNLVLMHAIPHNAAYEEFNFIEMSVIIVGLVLLGGVVALVLFLVLTSTRSQRSLVRFAQTDPLTGLFNKQHTQEAIDAWLKDDARSGIQAMMFLDIDYFKQINDRYGHNVGDEALRFVGKALRQEFRSSDIIGRIGGDEFVVFMRNVPVKHVVRAHAASLSKRMKSAEIPGLDQGMLHCSIGIAYAPEHGDSYRALTLYADKALYQTKERGRDGFTEYVDPLRQGQDKAQPKS